MTYHKLHHLNGSKGIKIKVLERPSQSPDLNGIEMLRQDFKQAIQAGKPSSVTEVKQFCKNIFYAKYVIRFKGIMGTDDKGFA